MRFIKGFIIFLLLSSSYSTFGYERNIVLNNNNTVIFRGEVSIFSVSKAIRDMSTIKSDTVYLYLDTPGGSIDHGMFLVHYIDSLRLKGKKIICIANYAASMGFVILQSCTERLMLKSGTVMHHQARYTISGQMYEIEARVKRISSMITSMYEYCAKRLNINVNKLLALINNEWWLDATAAIKANVADGTANVTCDSEISETKSQDIYTSNLGTVKVTLSNCPLVSQPLSIEFNKRSIFTSQQDFAGWVNSLRIGFMWKETRSVK